jgi:CHAD domain-containing protein
MTVSQAFRCIVRHCAAQIRANEVGVSVAEKWNVESLHQMRVGIRCLRTALEIFRKVQSFPDEWGQEMKWLDHQLSAARDWDVFSETTLPELTLILLKAGLESTHLTPSILVVKKRAQEEHSVAAAVICSARYSKLMLQLNRWLSAQNTKNKIRPNKRISLKKFSRDAEKKRLKDYEFMKAMAAADGSLARQLD